jgi:CheY-like chemotaxis protein
VHLTNTRPVDNPTTNPVLLLVEDELDMIQIIRLTIAKAGFHNRVMVARDGQEAIEYLEGQSKYHDRSEFPLPQIILLDLKMPRMDGLEFLRWLRQQPQGKTIPVVVLTGSLQNSDLRESYQAGANSFVVKGTNADELLSQITAIASIWLGDKICLPDVAAN